MFAGGDSNFIRSGQEMLKNDEEERANELDKLGSFEGHPEDHLTLLRLTRESVVVGARDALYNFSNNDLTQYSMLNWTSQHAFVETCQIKGQDESKCHNFIRVFHGPVFNSHYIDGNHQPKALAFSSAAIGSSSSSNSGLREVNEGQYLVCGTNAFKPTCRWYSPNLETYSKEFPGVGYSPFDPTHPSTSVLHHDSVYTATVADFGGTDALIYKQPLRTEQYFDVHLNSPAFVSSLSFGDLALFFFREAAVEHGNCGKAVFSRVARICRHDNGSRKHDRFTTFLKARLNCSIPGEYPFYFDHIQGTTDIFMNNERREEMLYAVFTTPPNSIGVSAVCSFYMRDILKAFDGPFKGHTSLNSNWLPVPDNEVPSPRPGKCSNDPNSQPDSASVAFLKGHPLMDESVQGTPLLTFTSSNKFTSIDVDHSPDVAPYHIIYIGTESGKVLKAVVNASDSARLIDLNTFSEDFSVISQSWNMFPNQKIKSVRLLDPYRLLVLTESEMTVIRVDNCGKFSNCKQCLEIRDPHCGWDKLSSQCVAKNPSISDKDRDENLIQDISGGSIHLCPAEDIARNEIVADANHLKSIIEEELNSKADGECCTCTTTSTTESSRSKGRNENEILEIVIRPQPNQSFFNNENDVSRIPNANMDQELDFTTSYVRGDVTSQSIALATVSSAVLALLVGFTLGFLVCKLIANHQSKTPTSTNAQLAATLNESQRLTSKPIDFVVNVPKNPLKNNLNTTDTLEKTVKKIYL
ncbi:Semaphorin-1A [Folsomia candida]|uniref:Semaphorin-1A n=1 Tax=Folsomia candida TaxID=158441 RepID=A0A226EPU1_FOLCA|nr:Semaphorin-1A [Folsomia candida]